MYDIVIIGSGPAGLSAAIYAQRESLKAVVVEKNLWVRDRLPRARE